MEVSVWFLLSSCINDILCMAVVFLPLVPIAL